MTARLTSPSPPPVRCCFWTVAYQAIAYRRSPRKPVRGRAVGDRYPAMYCSGTYRLGASVLVTSKSTRHQPCPPRHMPPPPESGREVTLPSDRNAPPLFFL